MEKTIYNVYVLITEGQIQCNRLKKLCIDNYLEYNSFNGGFAYSNKFKHNIFYKGFSAKKFIIACCESIDIPCLNNKHQVTEQEFIELLKTTK